jgi:hypothetical protein
MSNFQLHKGKFTTVGIILVDYDGNVDLTTPIQFGQTGPGALLIEPFSSAPSNRDFYVSVQASATQSSTGTVSLSANIPATGSGVGGPAVQKGVALAIDAVVPVDQRDATLVAPSTELPLPHA